MTVVGELLALLLMVTAPVEPPATVGTNATVNEVDCPGARVRGSVRPATEKPLPVTLSCDREMFALPVLVKVIVCVELVPVRTFPKLSAFGEAESCSTCATPVPDRETLIAGVGELFMSVSVPE